MPTKKSIHGCLMSTTDVQCRIEANPCDECQDLCWHIEVWAHDLAGTGEKACLLYRPHIDRRTRALDALGRWLIARAAGISELEQRAWMIEHQPSLW